MFVTDLKKVYVHILIAAYMEMPTEKTKLKIKYYKTITKNEKNLILTS